MNIGGADVIESSVQTGRIAAIARDEDRPESMRQRHRRGICGSCGIALGVALAAFAILTHATIVRAASPRPVYFFSDNSQPIGTHNRLVMRPSGFLLFLDGQWVLQNLHWTGWGSAVARATGISNASNDIPDAAHGRRIKTWADMTLSDPVRWHGHEVYSCFNILVPPPASDLSGCVLPNPPIGSGWLLGGAGGVEFLAPGQRIWCGMDASLSFCAGYAKGQSLATPPTMGATVYPSGKVVLCSVSEGAATAGNGCAQNWDAAAPVLTIGQAVRSGNVLCRSEPSGILCTIASGSHKGKGFLISGSTVSQRS